MYQKMCWLMFQVPAKNKDKEQRQRNSISNCQFSNVFLSFTVTPVQQQDEDPDGMSSVRWPQCSMLVLMVASLGFLVYILRNEGSLGVDPRNQRKKER